MANGLVQQHARPAWTENNFHLARRSLSRIKLQNSLSRRLFREVFRILFSEKEVESHTPTASGIAPARDAVFGLGDTGDIQASQRLRVFGERAIRSNHQNVSQFIAVAGADFPDPRVAGTGSLVGAH